MPLARPKEKIERRIGEKLFLKGERSFSPKSAVHRKPYPPGQHGRKFMRRGGRSEYGVLLREKQKVRYLYGLSDRMLKKYFTASRENRKSPTAENLAELLERRLDNVVFRLGLAVSRSVGRHLVSYGHIQVNGKRVRQPSFSVRIGDVISVRASSTGKEFFQNLGQRLQKHIPQEWLEVDKEKYLGKVLRLPSLGDIMIQQNMSLVVEYYSK